MLLTIFLFLISIYRRRGIFQRFGKEIIYMGKEKIYGERTKGHSWWIGMSFLYDCIYSLLEFHLFQVSLQFVDKNLFGCGEGVLYWVN